MIKAVIIDDEKNALEVLEMQLNQFCKQVAIVAICVGGKEGIKAIKELQPDIVFLDIEMPHVNGFDVLEQTKNYNYKVIFTTAYDQFAIKAFKFSAIDYLLKPIDIVDLKNAVAKFQDGNSNSNLDEKFKVLLSQYSQNANFPSKIMLPVGNMMEFFNVDDILRVESDSNYSHIFLLDKRKLTLSKTLKEVEENLKGIPFFRIHQSYLINANHVLKAVKGENAYVVMIDGTSITISRNRKEEFFELFRKI